MHQEYINNLNEVLNNNMLNKINLNLDKYRSSQSDTGYKGVYKHNDKFRVQLVNNYKRYSLGVYNNLDIAAKKYAMTDFLLKNNLPIENKIFGGISFNTGITEKKCKTNKDCSNAFNNLSKKEKVKCNKKTGICERILKVDKYINNKIDCRRKENKELAECQSKKVDCRKKENKNKKVCKNKKNSKKIDCRKKENKNKKVCKNK